MRERRKKIAVLIGATALALLLHALALTWLRWQMQPPSVLRDVAPTFYTRTLAPEQPAAPPAAAPAPPAAKPANRVAQARLGPAATQTRAKPARPRASAPARRVAQSAPPASAPAPQTPPPAQTGEAEPPASAALAAASAQPPLEPASAENIATAAEPPASSPAGDDMGYLQSWPPDTRLRYRLGGNYRGELHGNAQVLWQREGARYQAVIDMDVGFLLSTRFTSQGEITAAGLQPQAYEEQIRQKRRGVRIEPESVLLEKGQRVPRPSDVQDSASQFLELGHRMATGQIKLQAGGQIDFWLARPGGVDQWTYDVIGEETVYLPRLGPVSAFHLKPRPIAKPRGNIQAEMWFAPTLQYLPVRIRITQGEDNYLDLLVETVEQR